jgi:hypothetical protein
LFEVLQRLRSAGLATPIAFGRTPDARDYEVMEYFERGSLADWLARPGTRGRLDLEAAFGLILQFRDALGTLHGSNVVHRDIKPSNVLVRTEMLTVALADFGISRHVQGEVHRTTVARTVAYAAPEAHLPQVPLTPALDWWSVGMVLLETVAGYPFAGESEDGILVNVMRTGVPIPEDLPGEWRRLFQGLLTRDYDRRWGAAQVTRWLSGEQGIPVYYEGVQQPPDGPKPYKFGKEQLRDAPSLARAFARHWPDALAHFARGHVARWCDRELHDQDRTVNLDELANTRALDADTQLGLALLVLDPGMSHLVIRGEVVDHHWVSRDPSRAVKLAHSPAIIWLAARSRCPDTVGWGQACMERVSGLSRHGISVDPKNSGADIAPLLVMASPALRQAAEQYRSQFAEALTAELEALRVKPALTDIEAIVLLRSPPSHWHSTAERARRELRTAVQRLEIPTADFEYLIAADPDEAQRAAAQRRRDIALTYHPGLRRLLSTAPLAHAEAIALATAMSDLYLTRADRRAMLRARLRAVAPFLMVGPASWAVLWIISWLPATEVLKMVPGPAAPTFAAVTISLAAAWASSRNSLGRWLVGEGHEVWRTRLAALPFATRGTLVRTRIRELVILAVAVLLSAGMGGATWSSMLESRAMTVLNAQGWQLDLGREPSAQHQVDKAVTLAIRLAPNSPSVHAEAAKFARSLYLYDREDDIVQRAGSAGMYSGALRREAGFVSLRHGRLREAAAEFADAVRDDGDDRVAGQELGCLHVSQPATRDSGIRLLSRIGAKPEWCRDALGRDGGINGRVPVPNEFQMQRLGLVVGHPAPMALAEGSDGRPIDLSKVGAGRPALIEFSKTCGGSYCEKIRGQSAALQEKYGDRLKVVVLTEWKTLTAEELARYSRRPRGSYRKRPEAPKSVLILEKYPGAIMAFDVPAKPYIVVLDAQGKVAYATQGVDQDFSSAVDLVMASSSRR